MDTQQTSGRSSRTPSVTGRIGSQNVNTIVGENKDTLADMQPEEGPGSASPRIKRTSLAQSLKRTLGLSSGSKSGIDAQYS